MSPEVLTGLDCSLPHGGGEGVRGVGTLATEIRMTGGHILQVGTRTEVRHSPTPRRRRWSHYLVRPGVVEMIGRYGKDELVRGFLREDPGRPFDPGAVCEQWMNLVQESVGLDRRAPFTARRTRLRWVAAAATGQETRRIIFRMHRGGLRTVSLRAPADLLPRAPELFTDLALHDWLLSSVVGLVERSGIGRRERESVLLRLAPAIDHLLHLWMPAARLDDRLREYWEALDQRCRLVQQWEGTVRQIRDQTLLRGIGTAPVAPGSEARRGRAARFP